MHNICDIALNSAQEYCSNQYASWKKEEKKWAREKKQFREIVQRNVK